MTLTCVAWTVSIGIVFFLVKSRWTYLRLPELPAAGKNPGTTDVSVVIPARNEEANIGRAAASFVDAAVLVVDDDSSDRTAELARAAGATVIPAPPLSPGLLGKPNACLAGARASTSPWILFADADTWYQPEFLPALLAYAQSEQLAAASVFLKQHRVTFFERLLLPYAFALYFCGVSARRVNDSQSPEALANGQCLLFERAAYESMGGHAAVAGSVIEDVELARIAKQKHIRSRVIRAERFGSVRMYDSLGAIWRGFQKNSFRFLLVNPGSAVQVVAASILLTSYLPVLAWLIADHRLAASLAFAFVPALVLLPWYESVVTALLAPLAIYIFQLIVLDAMISTWTGRKTVWKGRRV